MRERKMYSSGTQRELHYISGDTGSVENYVVTLSLTQRRDGQDEARLI